MGLLWGERFSKKESLQRHEPRIGSLQAASSIEITRGKNIGPGDWFRKETVVVKPVTKPL